mgnify:CR=1 FL=1
MPWEAITQTATAITAAAGAVTALYTLGRQLGLWRALRQLGQRRRRGPRR